MTEKEWVLSDAHTHVGTEAERRERQEKGIVSLVCASAPEEARILFSHDFKYLIPTCGVHPWYAHKWTLEQMKGWMEKCPVIGEVGMDSVWCSVPLSLQEDVFCQQLYMACGWNKPVILHTKGQEKQIARMIKEYPNRYLVHWYSCEEYLEDYVSLGCYFSIGPDVMWNRAVRKVAEKVPRDRLLTETDGMEAVKWAYEEGKRVWDRQENSVSAALRETVRETSKILGMDPGDGSRMFKENLVSGFLKGILWRTGDGKNFRK